MSAVTPGMVCGHHHLYSTLARGMPAPLKQPTTFREILEQIWWRLDVALDLDMIYWSAALGAMEALQSGTTAIIDHHESPSVIEGSLSVIAQACSDVGIRVSCAYGVTDRHGSDGARRGLRENERFIAEGGRGMVGVHAAFTCDDDTLRTAAELAEDLGVGVHIHVAEAVEDIDAGRQLGALVDRGLINDDWLIVHCNHLEGELPGTLAHNPRSNMNNAVGYARPTRFCNRIVLGTDGIGADMLEEARLAYVRLREHDVHESPDTVWDWLKNGYHLMPEAADDRVTWNYDHADSAWHVAFTPGVRALHVTRSDGVELLRDGQPLLVDAAEVRGKAAEAAARLFARM